MEPRLTDTESPIKLVAPELTNKRSQKPPTKPLKANADKEDKLAKTRTRRKAGL